LEHRNSAAAGFSGDGGSAGGLENVSRDHTPHWRFGD
jgi:hypothetical protein